MINLDQISDRSVLAYITQQRLALPPGRIKADKKKDTQLTQIIDAQIAIAKSSRNKLAPNAFKFLMEAAFPDIKDKNSKQISSVGQVLENDEIDSMAVELVLSEK
jgi:hypothetical protein